MGKNKTNMFEAFRATSPKGVAARGPEVVRPAAPPREAVPAVEGSLVPRVPGGPLPGAASRPSSLGAPPDEGFALPFGVGTFLVLQVALLGVAFYLGMLTARDVRASGPEDAGADVAALDTDLRGGTRPGSGTGSAGGSAAGRNGAPSPTDRLNSRGTPPSTTKVPSTEPGRDQGRPAPEAPPKAPAPLALDPSDPAVVAFLDPANVFTLQVVSYDDTPAQRALAEHWRGVLAKAGLPVVLKQVKSKLSLFVGASPNAIEIDELAAAVRAVRDHRGEVVFPEPRSVPLQDFR